MELEEKQLEEVTGGARSEKEIIVTVDFSELHFNSDIDVKVYVNGELDRSKGNTLDYSVTSFKLRFVGSSGTKELKVKLNEYEKTYLLDFDFGTYSAL